MPNGQQSVQLDEAIRQLFVGSVPERQHELQTLWDDNNLVFNILPSVSEDAALHVNLPSSPGKPSTVEFNHRILRAFWVAVFAAWEGASAYGAANLIGLPDLADLSCFRELLTCVNEIMTADDPRSVPLPNIPEPGHFSEENVEHRATGELAVFAVTWAFLHEVRHAQHRTKGTGAPQSATAEQNHKEELSCDAFGASFILEKAREYATGHSMDPDLVERKRQLGLFFGLFALAVIVNGNWGATHSHPSVQSRIDQVWKLASPTPGRDAAVMGRYSFLALGSVMNGAPAPTTT